MSGRPVLAASAIDNVLFPAPASPVTTTRRIAAVSLTAIRTAQQFGQTAVWTR